MRPATSRWPNASPTLPSNPVPPETQVPGSVVFKQPAGRLSLANHFAWWDWLSGADWRHREGLDSALHGRERHPVLHVAWEDATAGWFSCTSAGVTRVVRMIRAQLIRK